MKAQLKFGLICNNLKLEKWQEKTLLKLMEINEITLSVVIFNTLDATTNPMIWSSREFVHKNLFFKIYYKFVSRKFTSHEGVDVTTLLSNVPHMKCKLAPEGKYSTEDIASIAELELDFILNFGSQHLQGDILNVGSYGIWTFQHNDLRSLGGVPCFWEIYNRDKITETTLKRLTNPTESEVILHKGYFSTICYSYVQNLDRTYFAGVSWPAKICRSILSGNDQYPTSSNVEPIQQKLPSNLEMLRYLVTISMNYFKFRFNDLFIGEEWNIGIINKPIESVLEGTISAAWFPKPKRGTFIADPFGKSSDGKISILVEDINYCIGSKGRISAIEIQNDAIQTATKETAIHLPTHLSYPYLIDHNNETYIIPENYENRKVTLFKATNFPYQWSEIKTLIDDFSAVDSTVFFYDNIWWLMCTNRETDSNCDLYIWYARNLLGPWEPHLLNPVKTDIRSSRPGGTPFIYKGELYRPAQNSVNTYGGSLLINIIKKLTMNEFVEEVVLEIKPDKYTVYNKGVHTLASMGNKTVIDGKRFVFLPSLFLHRLYRKIQQNRHQKTTRNNHQQKYSNEHCPMDRSLI